MAMEKFLVGESWNMAGRQVKQIREGFELPRETFRIAIQSRKLFNILFLIEGRKKECFQRRTCQHLIRRSPQCQV